MRSKFFAVGVCFLLLNSCFKTRADVNETEQYQIYNRKNVTNQKSARASDIRTQESQISSRQQNIEVDERDEMIRSYNGKIETLENQISLLQKDKANAVSATQAETQKLQAMQESITKMESQIQSLQNENANLKAEVEARKSSDEVAGVNNRPAAGRSSVTKPSEPTKSLPEAAKPSKTAETTKPTKATAVTAAAEPKTTVKSNSYDLAQEFFSKKEWKKAILSYQKYVDENPKGKNVAEAKYRIGVCFQELGMKEEAAAFYEEVVAQYPKTDAGKRAKVRLTKVKK